MLTYDALRGLNEALSKYPIELDDLVRAAKCTQSSKLMK
jgi:hypothetical protein